MRLPRMTTWRWMLALAGVALAIEGYRETRPLMRERVGQGRDYFLSLAQSHQKEVASSTARAEALKSRLGSTSEMTIEEITRLGRDYDRMMDRADYHASLARKYERAAARPWESVDPDPPEP